jgi:TonB family protein
MARSHFPGCCLIAAVIALPAYGQPTDAPGVTVLLNGSSILHRTPVPYPKGAHDKSIQGTVIVEATLDGTGNVVAARVLSGPEELRRAALESVLLWHFAQDAANSVRAVQIRFDLPPLTSRAPAPDFFPSLIVLQRYPAGPLDLPLRHIEILGLPEEARKQLAARLPVHEGDILTPDLADATGQAVRTFDEHLNLGFRRDPNGDALLEILAPGYRGPLPAVYAPAGVPR